MLRRTNKALWLPFLNVHILGIWRLPGASMPIQNSGDLKNIKFFATKSREQWDYQGIDEKITFSSQFRDTKDREQFLTGSRPDNSPAFEASMSNDFPHYKKLYEYFDEYTKPGTDQKVEAAKAVREQWDADEFYYPGETWKRNRPSFRSVPAEVLNRQTWYHWTDMIYNLEDLSVIYRSRLWNPQWPPPGYKMPKYNTGRQFVFGLDDPSLVAEAERFFWFRNWFENNARSGPWEWLGYVFFCLMWWVAVRSQHSNTKYRAMMSNQMYPGRQQIRSFGEPQDWATERWWWQEPLETWPNQGELWWLGEVRWKYINLKKKEDQENKLRDELSFLAGQTGRSGLTGKVFYANKHHGNYGNFYWMRYPGWNMQTGGTNLPRRPIGASGGNFNVNPDARDGPGIKKPFGSGKLVSRDGFQYEEDEGRFDSYFGKDLTKASE